jgi:hypothetical protein
MKLLGSGGDREGAFMMRDPMFGVTLHRRRREGGIRLPLGSCQSLALVLSLLATVISVPAVSCVLRCVEAQAGESADADDSESKSPTEDPTIEFASGVFSSRVRSRFARGSSAAPSADAASFRSSTALYGVQACDTSRRCAGAAARLPLRC